MNYSKNKYSDSVLLVTSVEKSVDFLRSLMTSLGSSDIHTVKSGSEARWRLQEKDFDLIIINAPLPDEFGTELAQSAVENSNSGVIMLVKSEIADEVSSQVEPFGISVVSKPINTQILVEFVKVVLASHVRIMLIDKENKELRQRIEEMRIVYKAKCVLIEKLGITEAEAHRSIEKQSMDMRTTKRKIAEKVLEKYDY